MAAKGAACLQGGPGGVRITHDTLGDIKAGTFQGTFEIGGKLLAAITTAHEYDDIGAGFGLAGDFLSQLFRGGNTARGLFLQSDRTDHRTKEQQHEHVAVIREQFTVVEIFMRRGIRLVRAGWRVS